MSIFELKTNINELSSTNDGISNMLYEQHAPTRDVTGQNFPNGAIHIRWQNSGTKWWVPSRSYLRFRVNMTKGDGTPLDEANKLAPNMGLCANLFQSMEFRIADKTISRVSDYVPQIDALDTRTSKSKAWLDSIGKSLNYWQSSPQDRQQQIIAGGVEAGVQPNKSTRTRLELGYAGPATAEVKAGGAALNSSVELAQGGGGALPTGLYRPGDVIVVAAQPLTIDAVSVDTGNGTTLLVHNASGAPVIALAAAAVAFSRIRTDVAPSRRAGSTELVWQPPLSIFGVAQAMPSGKYELVLNPQSATQYAKRAFESLAGDREVNTGVTAADVRFNVEDMYLYLATVNGERADNTTYLLDLSETRCQVDNVDRGGNFQQKNFDVSPSTAALTVAFQDSRAGNLNNITSSRFKINPNPQQGLEGTGADQELKLNRMFVNYAGVNRPQPDAAPVYQVGNSIDYTIQRYVDSQLYTGSYFDNGGGEELKEWQERGAYYYFAWPRDGNDRSTRVNVHFGFDGAIEAPPAVGAAAVAVGRVLLFDHSKKVARIQVQDGRVIMAEVQDA